MGNLLNCCQKDASDKTAEITIEKATPASTSGHPEEFGSTDFDSLFQQMKENSEKEIEVRKSRRDPEGSLAARFYINE